MKGVVRELRQYVTRPIIPFCFGIPLLLPATLLTVVAFLQSHISPLLHVLGILFLSLSLIAIACGMVLGFRDVCRNKTKVSKRPVTRGFQKVRRKSPREIKKAPNGNCVSPDSLSSPNSQNSSRRSSFSVGSTGTHMIITNEMIRLTPGKGWKSKKHRLLPRTARISNQPGRMPNQPGRMPNQPGRMPALQEEDHTHAREPSDVSRNSLRSSQTERNLQQLEKHLREVGLGMAHTAMAQSPVDVDVISTGSQCSRDAGLQPPRSGHKTHSRTRSMPEGEMHKLITAAENADKLIVPGSAREEQQLRRSARASRRAQEASQQQQQQQQQQPVLIGESYERTGVRSNIGGTLL